MIAVEFIIFIISSGLFCSERFRGNLTAMLVAGAIATGSSLMFAVDLGIRLMARADPPPAQVKIVKQIVRVPVPVPVVQKVNEPPSLPKAEDCHHYYPWLSQVFGDDGSTGLTFDVHADGTVGNVQVSQTSGSGRLDDAAIDCVRHWHYKPAIVDGKLVDKPWQATVVWNRSEK